MKRSQFKDEWKKNRCCGFYRPLDGKEGRRAYIAAGGRVVDVTGSRLWPAGRHMARHSAGCDLTADLAAAPHGPDVLDRYPQVGRFVEKPAGPEAAALPPLPPLVSAVLKRWPMLRRHPHPATVHFPIVFSLSAAFFSLLYTATGKTTFGCDRVLLPYRGPGIHAGRHPDGFRNVDDQLHGQAHAPRQGKAVRSFAAAIDLAIVIFWRAFTPSVPDVASAGGIIYLCLVVAQAPAILVVAYLGGMLTFPLDKD